MRRWIPLLLLMLLPAAHALTALPAATDLQSALAQAQQQRRPLIVLFSLPECPWCEKARQLSYADLARAGQPVVQVEMTAQHRLRDVDGRSTDGAALAARLHVKLAPTALFVGPGGRELAERMVGVANPDYYDALVRQNLDQAATAAGWAPRP